MDSLARALVVETLEQLNKQHGTRLLLSDAVVTALGPEAGFAMPLGDVAVRGYTDPVKVWRLDRQCLAPAPCSRPPPQAGAGRLSIPWRQAQSA